MGCPSNHQADWSPPAPPLKLKVVVAEGSVAPASWPSKPLTLIARRQVVTCEFGVLVDGPDRDGEDPAAGIPTLVVRWLAGGETPADLEKIKAAYEHPPALRLALVAAHPFVDVDFTWSVLSLDCTVIDEAIATDGTRLAEVAVASLGEGHIFRAAEFRAHLPLVGDEDLVDALRLDELVAVRRFLHGASISPGLAARAWGLLGGVPDQISTTDCDALRPRLRAATFGADLLPRALARR